MKLAGLNIDQFGTQTQLDLPEISDGLNVIFGPNGSGKSTIIRFLRWMMFGEPTTTSGDFSFKFDRSNAEGQLAWPTKVASPKGTIQLRSASGTLTFDRPGVYSNIEANFLVKQPLASAITSGLRSPWGSHAGQLERHVANAGDIVGVYSSEMSPRDVLHDSYISTGDPNIYGRRSDFADKFGSHPDWKKYSSDVFDRFFNLSFDQPRDCRGLLNAARMHGFQFDYDQRQLDRIAELTDEIRRKVVASSSLSVCGDSVQTLRTRRNECVRSIESLRREYAVRCAELARDRQRAQAELQQLQVNVDRRQSEFAGINAAIQERHGQLLHEYQRVEAAHQESLDRRNRRNEEIDAHIRRWQDVLNEIRHRLNSLRAQLNTYSLGPISRLDAADAQQFMRSLGARIQDIEASLGSFDTSESGREVPSAGAIRDLSRLDLESVRADIIRLCQAFEQHQQAIEYQEYREEETSLARLEREFVGLIAALQHQRQQQGHFSLTWESFPDRHIVEAWLRDPHSRPGHDAANALRDVRLSQLFAQWDVALSRLHDAKQQLVPSERQLHEISTMLRQLGHAADITVPEQQIRDIDSQILRWEQRIVAQREIDTLEAELRQLQLDVGQSQLVEESNHILQRLSNFEFGSLRITDDSVCQVKRRDGLEFSYAQLSQGVQDQVFLSFALAIASAFQRRNGDFPLILNDVFVNLDQEGTRRLVAVLANMATQGQQLLVFTRHEHIRRAFEPFAARICALRSTIKHGETMSAPMPSRHIPLEPVAFAPSTAVAELPPTSPDPTYRWIAEWQRSPAPVSPTVNPLPTFRPTPPLTPPTPPTKESEPPTPSSSLRPTSQLSEVPTLSIDLIRLLGTLEVQSVDAFLDLDPGHVESILGSQGITADIIQRRQREVLLLVYLGVSALEAQLLVACGVPDPQRLGRADADVLLKRIGTILESRQAAARFGTIEQYPIQRIQRWIGLAQRSNFPDRSARPRRNEPTRVQRIIADDSVATRPIVRDTSNADRATVRMLPETELRFYLDVTDPVVDAPSIGPKTAERMHAVDIYTVGDLLNADPIEVAKLLDDRRINAASVQSWQTQAQLVCRIPNLRGHDAQILVACGINDPSALAMVEPSRFLKKVMSFVDTKEGQRVLRNGKRPDLAEITAWIEWSQQARKVRAA